MMVVEATEKHRADAQHWDAARRCVKRPECEYSTTGFAVDGVAAVWLYMTNSGLAYLDAIAANPNATAEERDAALDAVISVAIAAAKEAGFAYVLAAVDLPAVEKRAVRLGFHVAAPHTVMMALALKGTE